MPAALKVLSWFQRILPRGFEFKAVVIGGLLLILPGFASSAPPPDFDNRVQAIMQQQGVPGAAVAIVEGGQATLARGYGVKGLEHPQPVGADTLFQIGSASKAFTAAALAILVEEGEIRWDDPVIDHLPGFRMYDPWVTREITVRDLLVHRSGLGRGQGDLLLVPATNISRADTVRRLRFLKPVTSFRSSFAYDNILYIVAGELIEAVTGQTWEVFVRDRLLRPAGMATSVTNDGDRMKAADRAFPHGRMGEILGVGAQQALDERAVALGANSAPAGAIAAGANDLARWLAVQLARGELPGSGQRLFSAANSQEMWQPAVPIPVTALPGALADATPLFRTYALGWIVQDYRGHRIIQHAGGTQGFRAIVVLIPDKQVGFAIVNNSDDNAFVPGLEYELLDHYLGLPKHDWPRAFDEFFAARNTAGLETLRAAAATRPKSTPSLPPAGYAGNYVDPWYGPIEIREQAGALAIEFLQTPGMKGPLEHWAYDTFIVRWSNPMIEPAYVTFALDAQGKPERISMKAVSPVADFSFDYHDLSFTPSPSSNP
jgi:CubicO group peptidase (beta-lactamase class C family)